MAIRTPHISLRGISNTERGQCYKLPIKAEILDNLVVRDAKNFMTTADFEKLLHSNDDSVHEKEVILSEQLKRLSKEKTQLEKELHKLRDEVCKVIMGESQWSQSVLSQLIETKEQELSDIVKKQEDIEFKLKELAAYLAERKANLSELNNWAERFDIPQGKGYEKVVEQVRREKGIKKGLPPEKK